MKFWECREIRHEFIFYGGKLFESIRNVVYEHTIKFDFRFRRKKLINPIRIFTIFIVQTLYKHSIPNIFAMSVHTEHTLKILRFLSRIDWYSSTLGTVNYFMVKTGLYRLYVHNSLSCRVFMYPMTPETLTYNLAATAALFEPVLTQVHYLFRSGSCVRKLGWETILWMTWS